MYVVYGADNGLVSTVLWNMAILEMLYLLYMDQVVGTIHCNVLVVNYCMHVY